MLGCWGAGGQYFLWGCVTVFCIVFLKMEQNILTSQKCDSEPQTEFSDYFFLKKNVALNQNKNV